MARRKSAPTSPDEQALLAEVTARSGGSLPRLVYADWLDQHAHSQDDRAFAEFIRLECRLDEADDVVFTGLELDEMNRRLRELLGRHEQRWRRRLPAWARP